MMIVVASNIVEAKKKTNGNDCASANGKWH